jgi:MGT family glycosyltransferase
VHYVGPLVWNKPSDEPPPAWLDELPADVPWVHVTEGTVHHQDPFVLRAAARGLADGPFQAILTTGPRRTPEELGLTPAAQNVHVEQWVSHADLLPRCAVLVTTGGAATILASLQAGVPLVVVPTHWDKADNARRVVTAGVGVALSPRQCTPRRLRSAVEQVLADPRFRSNARHMASLFKQAPGPHGACELLEELAGEIPLNASQTEDSNRHPSVAMTSALPV